MQNNRNNFQFSVRCMSMLLWIGFILTTLTSCHGRTHLGSRVCERFESPSKCPNCPDVAVCSQADNETSFPDDHHMQCYAVMSVTADGKIETSMKGCWLNNEPHCRNNKCVAKGTMNNKMFCCCEGDMCNKNTFFRPDQHHTAQNVSGRQMSNRVGGFSNHVPAEDEPGVVRRAAEDGVSKTILFSIVPIVAIAILMVTIYFMWRRHHHHLGHHQLPTMDPNLAHTPAEEALDIQLLEHKAKGRFGYVWKAMLRNQFVAVKIFPLADRKSFSAEVDIYKTSCMSHENILRFIASEVKQDSSYIEYFLVTEYHDRGSLYDFLKANTITWAQLCRIGETMTCGLAYLHDEIPATSNTGLKPAIAHRDLKSKNVLIKDDLSACIADFGLALAFDPNMGVNETHTQVGTRRYMAPEVLEGAICFNMDSFLRIDMYACSLVLWELMTRCTCVEDVVDDYRLPFEAEVGLQPSLEEMQPLVAGQKRRPAIKPAWYQSQGMASLVTTMEECWDQDADARLSAGCVHERISHFSRTINTGGDNNTLTDTSPPPFYYGHQQIQQQQRFPCQTGVNNSLPVISNQHPPQYYPQHLQHQQQPPPVYAPNNNSYNNNNNNNNRSSTVNSTSNTVNDNTLSSSPMGVNVTATSDLSSC